jgi:hypothetical protein
VDHVPNGDAGDVLRLDPNRDGVAPPDAGEGGRRAGRPPPARRQTPVPGVRAEVSAQGLTLTATTAGARGPRSRTASPSAAASSGQRFRQTGSMNVTITGRPRSAASETGAPFPSCRRNWGARRLAAPQETLGVSGAALGVEPRDDAIATAIPIAAPSATATSSTMERGIDGKRRTECARLLMMPRSREGRRGG